MREVPKKNYLYLGLMTVGVVVIVLVLVNMYRVHNKQVYDSRVKDVISEIKYDNLDDYIIDNPNTVIYVNDSDKNSKKIEREIRELITEKNARDYIVYLEKTDEVVKKYDLNKNVPIFIAYKDGKVAEILSKSEYDIATIESFLIRNGAIEND
jgi:PHD/YefM family antitoxin component YafN of YafNO toxin-antitoxin module